MSLERAARKFRDAFTYDPGHSDLDNEQPIHITVTLGDWRLLNRALSLEPEVRDTVTVSRSLAERTEAMFRSVDPESVIAQEWKLCLPQGERS